MIWYNFSTIYFIKITVSCHGIKTLSTVVTQWSLVYMFFALSNNILLELKLKLNNGQQQSIVNLLLVLSAKPTVVRSIIISILLVYVFVAS